MGWIKIKNQSQVDTNNAIREFIDATDIPFLDSTKSLKRHIISRLHKLSPEEKLWFKNKREFSQKRRKRKEVSFLFAIPDITESEVCSGFIVCMHREPGLRISQIATKLGVYGKDIQRYRHLLIDLKLITIEYQGFLKDRTRCYLNNEEKDDRPFLPNVIEIILRLKNSFVKILIGMLHK